MRSPPRLRPERSGSADRSRGPWRGVGDAVKKGVRARLQPGDLAAAGGLGRGERRSKLIAAFGDDTTALIMYDTQTKPVSSAPAAECVTVADGKITYSRFIFDRAPFAAARSEAAD